MTSVYCDSFSGSIAVTCTDDKYVCQIGRCEQNLLDVPGKPIRVSVDLQHEYRTPEMPFILNEYNSTHQDFTE